jgi:hypothetical protein
MLSTALSVKKTDDDKAAFLGSNLNDSKSDPS